VQYNAGVIRAIQTGRPRVSNEEMVSVGVRIQKSYADRIPGVKSEWIRDLIIRELSK
jgi:hypothetical protein